MLFKVPLLIEGPEIKKTCKPKRVDKYYLMGEIFMSYKS